MGNDTENARIWIVNQEINSWKELFSTRLIHVERSLIYLIYFKSLGINDLNWINRGKGSAKFFPDFNSNDYIHKDLFDYYVDAFLNKGFSSLEILAHILVKRFNLILKKRVSFVYVMELLENKEHSLFAQLNYIFKSDNFEKGKHLRNDFTHNYPGTEISPIAITNSDKKVKLGSDIYTVTATFGFDNLKYTASDETITICRNFWDSLMGIVHILNTTSIED